MTATPRTLGVVGTGVVGSGWVARALAQGLDVIAWDVAPGWQGRLRDAVANAWPALQCVGLHPDAGTRRLRAAASLDVLCRDADYIQEAAPERLDLKRGLLADLDGLAGPDVLIASSTSGFKPTDLQAGCERHPERVLVGHPFNPVYLLPLVEVVGGERTAAETVVRAIGFYRDLGMQPLHVRREIDGFLSDRLQEALWREALHLVNDDVATTAEIDAAITYGPGLRWAFLGTCLAFHMAGGDGGMRHFLDQFGPALEQPWTRLEAPELTAELAAKMTTGTAEQAAGVSVKELERRRDACLVAILDVLRRHGMDSGGALAGAEPGRGATHAPPLEDG